MRHQKSERLAGKDGASVGSRRVLTRGCILSSDCHLSSISAEPSPLNGEPRQSPAKRRANGRRFVLDNRPPN
jgi:hypothetical protein